LRQVLHSSADYAADEITVEGEPATFLCNDLTLLDEPGTSGQWRCAKGGFAEYRFQCQARFRLDENPVSLLAPPAWPRGAASVKIGEWLSGVKGHRADDKLQIIHGASEKVSAKENRVSPLKRLGFLWTFWEFA